MGLWVGENIKAGFNQVEIELLAELTERDANRPFEIQAEAEASKQRVGLAWVGELKPQGLDEVSKGEGRAHRYQRIMRGQVWLSKGFLGHKSRKDWKCPNEEIKSHSTGSGRAWLASDWGAGGGGAGISVFYQRLPGHTQRCTSSGRQIRSNHFPGILTDSCKIQRTTSISI